MDIFQLLPIDVQYFNITDIEEKQLDEIYKDFILSLNNKNYEYNNNEKNSIKLEPFSLECLWNENSISIYIKYNNKFLEKKEMDAYDPLKKFYINTGKEKLDLTFELIDLKPYKIKIHGKIYIKLQRKWEAQYFNQIISMC